DDTTCEGCESRAETGGSADEQALKLPERPTQQARLQRAPDDGSVGCFGSKGWPSTTAEAMSMSFRLADRACVRSMSKAVASSTECRSMRIPFARSVTARRPKAPSRSVYSAKRRRTMSIELCQSVESASVM